MSQLIISRGMFWGVCISQGFQAKFVPKLGLKVWSSQTLTRNFHSLQLGMKFEMNKLQKIKKLLSLSQSDRNLQYKKVMCKNQVLSFLITKQIFLAFFMFMLYCLTVCNQCGHPELFARNSETETCPLPFVFPCTHFYTSFI